MKFETPVLIAVIAGAVLIVSCWIAKHFFSDTARWERRRRRSNAPITTKQHNRPTVRFSVNVPKDRKR